MSIFVVGVNHKTAPVHLREQIYFAPDKLSLYSQDLLTQGLVREVVLLSTCNRSELYCEADEVDEVLNWFCAQSSIPRIEWESAIYVFNGEAAVSHIMQVACGLDSMILGEPQILGQLKDAFSESCTTDAIGPVFHPLFQRVFSLAKEIRSVTAIGACPVSVASAAAHFAAQQVNAVEKANVVLVGAGDTTGLLLRYLKNSLTTPVALVNRSIEKAEALAQTVGAKVFGLNQLTEVLAQADLVFTATGSPVPLITKTIVAEAMAVRPGKPLTFIDIAVPRDVDPAVSEVEQVQLFCIDDLKAIIETNRQGREHAADKAREMIRIKSLEFITSQKFSDKTANAIRAYRGQIEEICRAELKKAKQQLRQGEDASLVLEAFANAYTKKLLHAPSVQLRQAGAEGRFELLRFAKQLFALPDPEVERL